MRWRTTAVLLSIMAALGFATTVAEASTGGTPDGDEHPAVGFMVAYNEDGGRYRCSATLVGPEVLLTAAHCNEGVVGQVLVTFDSEIAETSPLPFPVAADLSLGYTAAEIEGAGYLVGTPHLHPAYSSFTDRDNWNDVGVVELEEAVNHIAPATLAPLGELDTLSQSSLTKTLFRAVGYGTEFAKPEDGPRKALPMTFPLLRRYVDVPGQKLTPQILQASNNSKDPHGTGGVCVGDSGGPVFLDGEIVAVTSYGINENCKTLAGYQRVDIPVVRDWLGGFGL